MADVEVRSVDPASQQMIVLASEAGIETVWDRLERRKAQCKFGRLGLCCRNCFMGPCRVNPDGKGAEKGICGAGGGYDRRAEPAAAHRRGRGRPLRSRPRDRPHVAPGRDRARPRPTRSAARSGSGPWPTSTASPTSGLSDQEVAKELANLLSGEFGKQDGTLINLRRAPEQQQKNWAAADTAPRGIDREVVTGLHMTNMGVDNDAEHLLLASVRTALADGWGGSMIATDVSDVLFGEPHPLRSRVNLGVLKADEVNILVHGHEPTLSDVMVAAARDPELLAEAAAKGAKGINLAGICCTANEILMRHGIPIAGNFLQQELAIMTGAVDVMLVDVQCVFPALTELQKCFHTKIVSTSSKATFPDAVHIEFHEDRAMETAREIIRVAIENYTRRDPAKVNIPKVAGAAGRRIHHGGDFQHPRRPVSSQFPPAERRHPDGTPAGRGRRGGLQQSQVPPRRMPPGDGQGTHSQRRAGRADRLQRDRLRQGRAAWRPRRQ